MEFSVDFGTRILLRITSHFPPPLECFRGIDPPKSRVPHNCPCGFCAAWCPSDLLECALRSEFGLFVIRSPGMNKTSPRCLVFSNFPPYEFRLILHGCDLSRLKKISFAACPMRSPPNSFGCFLPPPSLSLPRPPPIFTPMQAPRQPPRTPKIVSDSLFNSFFFTRNQINPIDAFKNHCVTRPPTTSCSTLQTPLPADLQLLAAFQ